MSKTPAPGSRSPQSGGGNGLLFRETVSTALRVPPKSRKLSDCTLSHRRCAKLDCRGCDVLTRTSRPLGKTKFPFPRLEMGHTCPTMQADTVVRLSGMSWWPSKPRSWLALAGRVRLARGPSEARRCPLGQGKQCPLMRWSGGPKKLLSLLSPPCYNIQKVNVKEIHSVGFFFFKFIYLERESVSEGGAERERERDSQIDSVLSVQSQTRGSNSRTVKS